MLNAWRKPVSTLVFFFRPLHQRGPPIIRNKNPYPEFHGKEAEIYQPQTRYEELPRLAPPREEFRDTGTYVGLKFGILLPKLFWPTVRKNCSSDQENFWNSRAEGQEFAKILRSLEQFVRTVKGQNNFW